MSKDTALQGTQAPRGFTPLMGTFSVDLEASYYTATRTLGNNQELLRIAFK